MVRSRARLSLPACAISTVRRMGWCRFKLPPGKSFIFVNLNPEAPPLESQLDDLPQRISVAGLRFFARKSYTLACNWKVYVDNYLDGGYHVPHLHKALNSVLDYKEYTIENGAHYALQSSPMVASQDASVAQTRTGDRAYYYWLYPNFMINLYQGVMDTNLVLPLGREKCLVVFDFFFADTSPEYNEESVAVSDRVQAEDVDICESVQRGLHSRAYNAGRLSVRRETGEHLFHRLLAHDLKRGLTIRTKDGGRGFAPSLSSHVRWERTWGTRPLHLRNESAVPSTG